MSIELILIPMAIAAVSAWQAKNAADDDGRQVVAVGTRMRNDRLLQFAIVDTGAQVSRHGDVITATWPTSQGRFTRDIDGIWSAHFVGDTSLDTASNLIANIDTAYGRHVQQEVLTRLRERAPTAGMAVESETVEDDHSITLVLNVNTGA